jgi:hypothetical protein
MILTWRQSNLSYTVMWRGVWDTLDTWREMEVYLDWMNMSNNPHIAMEMQNKSPEEC